ncbi:hypothetical protein DCO57_16835 [Labrenzia sp. 011]|nr:hypothetical protein DCO57_16835 [Labrenzia sp. 011]
MSLKPCLISTVAFRTTEMIRTSSSLALSIFAAVFATSGALASDDALPDGPWKVMEIDGAASAEDVASTLTISADGTASGQAGCNRFTTQATIEGQSLTFGAIAVTRMMCSEAEMQQEKRFLDALAATARWENVDGALALYDGTNKERLRFGSALSEISFKVALPQGETVDTLKVTYECESRSLDVEYINAGPISLAILRMPDETVVASQVISGSGVRYAGGEYVWWTKGMKDASLQNVRAGEDAPVETCTAP